MGAIFEICESISVAGDFYGIFGSGAVLVYPEMNMALAISRFGASMVVSECDVGRDRKSKRISLFWSSD